MYHKTGIMATRCRGTPALAYRAFPPGHTGGRVYRRLSARLFPRQEDSATGNREGAPENALNACFALWRNLGAAEPPVAANALSFPATERHIARAGVRGRFWNTSP